MKGTTPKHWRERTFDDFGLVASRPRGSRVPRLQRIASRATAMRRMDELSTGGASLVRDIDDEEIDRRRFVGQQAGAEWVARSRGLK